jgi:hypothetical protein
MTSGLTISVLTGLAVGIAFILLVALATSNNAHFGSPPIMFLTTISDGDLQTYKTFDNSFCGQERCDFMLLARVRAASPEIIISDRTSEVAFRTGHLGQRQPDELTFDIKRLESGADGRSVDFINTGLQLQETGERRFLLPHDIQAGSYVISVIATWVTHNTSGSTIQDLPYLYSLHRFNVIVR